MLGEFQLETSEGFSDYMYEIGVNWFTRQVRGSTFERLDTQLSVEDLL